METACRWEWLGDDWYQDWEEPPSPCTIGNTCIKPAVAGAFVGQLQITDCTHVGED